MRENHTVFSRFLSLDAPLPAAYSPFFSSGSLSTSSPFPKGMNGEEERFRAWQRAIREARERKTSVGDGRNEDELDLTLRL